MKILAASIPEYFPSINFFLKMYKADVFVIADNLQYSKHTLVNRSKINTADGMKWLTVPVLTSKQGLQKINEINILSESNWQRKHLLALKSNYKHTPYFEYYMQDYQSILTSVWKKLFLLDDKIILLLQKQLKIQRNIFYSSEIITNETGTKRIIDLVKKCNCDSYLIFQSELRFVDKNLLNNAGIKLIIKSNDAIQSGLRYAPSSNEISVIDLLFNHGNETFNYIYTQLEKV